MLIVFLAYFSSPGYPDSKTKTIHNLPVNQDMSVRSWRTSEDEKIVLEAMEQSDCPDCWTKLNNATECRRCVELREDCQNCCFSDENPATRIIKCTEEDTSEDYKCKSELFDRDECDLVVCDEEDDNGNYTSDCMSKCADYEGYESGSACVEEKQTGGKPKTSEPYGLQRRGCPEKDSEDLAPDGSCSLVETGTGLERKWKCSRGDLQPKFGGCDPDSASGLIKPSSNTYYVITKATPSCTSSCFTSPCTSDCSSPSTGCSVKSACTPSCSSSCDPSCVPSCYSGNCSEAESSCSATCSSDCTTNGSCWPSCSKEESCPPKGKCSSWCTKSSCNTGCSSSCEPEAVFYIYALSREFKDYIKDCISYADTYEECADRVHCCEKGACQDISAKNKKTEEYKCAAGFSGNCVDCVKRVCYHDDCAEFTAIGAEKSCPQLASDVHSCLVEKKNSECFKEIKTNNKPFYSSYVASSNDALNIIWQITSTSSDKDVKGLNFYTLVKVFKLDASGNREEPPAHTSMANVKSQEAAFSIYGTTNVAKGKLLEGASYRVYLYYFLPPGEFCDVKCETCKNDTTIELTYVSLILQRVRE